ncbi:hypothetical protein NLU13_2552 [Sarocladium strictum]|uniref:Beta-xylosidase C-terminal Concanavalin A-like domain-containing protein n=1 Tax=Sarocladium strictum TaxID=5046 RepID=A0AA39GKD0_SARSR|nr:hypothetical protein NLU13_2552 [Sarocladium strictum]
MRFTTFLSALGLTSLSTARHAPANSTFLNPVLPGWHSDPSCTRVDDTYYCATSTFIAFPGLPVYASKDLINWRLASHAWSRDSQLPGVSWNTWGQQDGMFAPTLRHHDGEFFLICEYLGQSSGSIGVVFRTRDPFDDDAWSDPVRFETDKIDPDLFWDDDGKVYVATQGIILQEIDLETGEMSQPPVQLWNGSKGADTVWPEGPHIYKKDGWYYLLIAEGGTATNHAVTIARAPAIDGPYEQYAANPILTNLGTSEYFQTVGHADLFTDTQGNWWGLALATRSGPEWDIYPMGREAVMFPVTWEEGAWPVCEPVRGRMSGWHLRPPSRDVPGDKPFNADPDFYAFTGEDARIPAHFMHWRVPREGSFTTTPRGLRVVPSRANLTGQIEHDNLSGRRGLSFVGRRQTDTIFRFSVDLTFDPDDANQEAGVTMFLTQYAHVDLAVQRTGSGARQLRFHAVGNGAPELTELSDLPDDLAGAETVRLWVRAVSPTLFELAVGGTEDGDEGVVVGSASAKLLSGGTGSFVGSLVGVYATCNGNGDGEECPDGGDAYFTNWRYTPIAQFISANESVPADVHPRP